MRYVIDNAAYYARFLFWEDPDDPFGLSDRRMTVWLWIMGGTIAAFWLWIAFLQVRLRLFGIPSRWHKPEALARYGITPRPAQRPTGSVMAQLGLTFRNIVEGVVLIGAIGAGKSSILYRLMAEVLMSGCGCIWMALKPDEPMAAAKVMHKAGRTAILFIPGETKWNPMTYEFTRPGGDCYTFAQQFETADEIMNGGKSGKEESFWQTSRRRTLALGSAVVWIVYRNHATLDKLYDFLVTSPPTTTVLASEAFKNSTCYQLLNEVRECAQHPAEQRLVNDAYNHFTNTLCSAGEKVYGATTMHITGLLSMLLTGAMWDTVNCVESNISVTDPLHGKCIIFTNSAIISPGNRLVQILFSQMAIDATLRRPVTPDMPIVAVIRDEYQLLAHARKDAQDQTIARSQKLACITAFQSISVLKEAMSEPVRAKDQAMSLLGNLNCKWFGQNSDEATMEYFSMLTGKHFRTLTGGAQKPEQQQGLLGVGEGFNMSFHQQLMNRKLGTALTNLRTGGPENDFVVEGYVIRPGRQFNGQTFAKCAIQQDIT